MLLSKGTLFFLQVVCCNEQAQKNEAYKIYEVPAIEYATADASIVKIDAKHFYIIISSTLQHRQLTQSIEPKIKNEAGERTYEERYHCIVCKTAATQADGSKNCGQ